MSTASGSRPTSGSPARYLRHAPKKRSRTCSRLGSNTAVVLRRGLRPELAQIADQAARAAGLAREADVAAVQDQPVMRVLQEFGRRELEQFLFDLERILPRCDSRAIGDAEDVRVDRDGGLAEGGVQHHARRLAPDAGKLLERLAVLRHGAAVPVEDDLRQADDVL